MESEMLERLKVWTHSLTSAKAPPLGPGGSAAQQLADSGRTSHLILALPTSEPATDFDHEKPSDSGIISAATTLDQTAATSTPVQTPNRTQTHTSPASAMASSSTQTAKKDDKAATEKQPEQASAQQKSAAALEEDDEFEDFPVDGVLFPVPVTMGPVSSLHP